MQPPNHEPTSNIQCCFFPLRLTQLTLPPPPHPSLTHSLRSFPTSTRTAQCLEVGRGEPEVANDSLTLRRGALSKISESATLTASLALSCEVTRCRAGRSTLGSSPPPLFRPPPQLLCRRLPGNSYPHSRMVLKPEPPVCLTQFMHLSKAFDLR